MTNNTKKIDQLYLQCLNSLGVLAANDKQLAKLVWMEITGEDHDGTIESNGKIGTVNGKDIHILNGTLTRSKARKASDTAQWYALAFRVELQHGKHHQLPYCLSSYKNMSSKLDGVLH